MSAIEEALLLALLQAVEQSGLINGIVNIPVSILNYLNGLLGQAGVSSVPVPLALYQQLSSHVQTTLAAAKAPAGGQLSADSEVKK